MNTYDVQETRAEVVWSPNIRIGYLIHLIVKLGFEFIFFYTVYWYQTRQTKVRRQLSSSLSPVDDNVIDDIMLLTESCCYVDDMFGMLVPALISTDKGLVTKTVRTNTNISNIRHQYRCSPIEPLDTAPLICGPEK